MVDNGDSFGKEDIKDLLEYVKITEKLNMISAKEDLKIQIDPKLERFKTFFSSGTVNFLDKYSKFLSTPREWITKKTSSNIKGLAGGAIVMGGAIAFAANFIPGIRGTTRALSVAVTTYGFQKRAKESLKIEEEKILDKKIEEIEERIQAIDGELKKQILKTELGLEIKDIPEKIIQETEDKYNTLIKSLAKAILVSTAFYES